MILNEKTQPAKFDSVVTARNRQLEATIDSVPHQTITTSKWQNAKGAQDERPLPPARLSAYFQNNGGLASCASCNACCGNQTPAAGSSMPQSGSKRLSAAAVDSFQGLYAV